MTAAPEAQPSDDELMRRLADGDPKPLAELYLRHGGAVRSFLYRLLDMPQEAEDLCQDVFITLQQTAVRYQARGNLRAWIFGIAVRKARSQRRNRWIRQRLLTRFAHEAPRGQPAIDARISASEAIEKALGALSVRLREVVVLHVIEGISGSEVAATLGIDENTVWTRLHRARRILRARWQTVEDMR